MDMTGHGGREKGRKVTIIMMTCARDDTGLTCILVLVKDMLHATEGIVL